MERPRKKQQEKGTGPQGKGVKGGGGDQNAGTKRGGLGGEIGGQGKGKRRRRAKDGSLEGREPRPPKKGTRSLVPQKN